MRGFFVAFSLAAALAAPRPADACSCMDAGPACQAFWKTDAVFDATVESIDDAVHADRAPDGVPLAAQRRVTLKVRQAWKGVTPGPLDVFTTESGTSCGYDFKPGRRYLVFAFRNARDGRWMVSLCSATREYDGSGDEAAFLASLAEPARGGRIFGTVKAYERQFDQEHSSRERNIEVRITLSGAGKEWTAISRGGTYEFTALPSGPYRLEMAPVDGYVTNYSSRSIELPTDRACARETFSVAPSGRLTGRVVEHDGRPASRVTIEVTAPGAQPHPMYGISSASTTTEADGRFEVGGLPPGEYMLGVNLDDLPSDYRPYPRTLYPSDGTDGRVFTIGRDPLDIGTWTLPPPLPVVTLSGIVVWADGTPAAGVDVSVWDETNNPVQVARGAGGAIAAVDGRFSIRVRQGRSYRFGARGKDSRLLNVIGPRLTIGTDAIEPVRLIVAPR
jgi:hypothetical protein